MPADKQQQKKIHPPGRPSLASMAALCCARWLSSASLCAKDTCKTSTPYSRVLGRENLCPTFSATVYECTTVANGVMPVNAAESEQIRSPGWWLSSNVAQQVGLICVPATNLQIHDLLGQLLQPLPQLLGCCISHKVLVQGQAPAIAPAGLVLLSCSPFHGCCQGSCIGGCERGTAVACTGSRRCQVFEHQSCDALGVNQLVDDGVCELLVLCVTDLPVLSCRRFVAAKQAVARQAHMVQVCKTTKQGTGTKVWIVLRVESKALQQVR